MDLLSELTDEQLQELKGKRFGLYRGLVRDVDDPEARGRLRLEVPEVWSGGRLSNWAAYCSAFGGGGAGFYFLPRPGDGVWVLFERGEPTRPVWIGFWFNQQDPRPEPGAKDVRVLRSKSGHRIVFGDEAGSEFIEVRDKAGNFIRIDSNAGKIVVAAGQSLLLGSAGAAEPLVLGNAFKTFFNAFVTLFNTFVTAFDSHSHIGNLGAPTSPPTAPFAQSQTQMSASELSAKAKTEA